MKIIYTYILKCSNGEFYCGKSYDINKRLLQHRSEKSPSFFSNDKRRNFSLFRMIIGDYEKDIKRFGVKKFSECVDNINDRVYPTMNKVPRS